MRLQKVLSTGLLIFVFVYTAPSGNVFADADDSEQIAAIIPDIERGWKYADAGPFRRHFLDFDGARYIESGGQNKGLQDLIEHHVLPEGDSLQDFELKLSDIEPHIEGDFAWAIANVEVMATVKADGRKIHNRGYETFLFRRVGADWKVVHTHSSSRPVDRKTAH